MLSLTDAAEDHRKLLSLRGVALAGSLAALTAAFLYCRVPQASPRTLSAVALLLLSARYVFLTLAIGMAVTWIYFRRSTLQPSPVFQSLARSLYLVWLFFPSFVLFLWQESIGLLIIAPAAFTAMAICLQKLLPVPPTLPIPEEKLLFAEPPPPPTGRLTALLSSICIYAATIAAINQAVVKASFALATCAFLLASHWLAINRETRDRAERQRKPAQVTPMATAAILAVLVTWIALVPWLRRSLPAAQLAAGSPTASSRKPAASSSANSLSPNAYHAILLWPFPPREKPILPPIPQAVSFRAGANAAPLVIPFDGSYRYFETPGTWQPSKAHVAQGNPLNLSIHSADWGLLFMEAHQQLAQPLSLTCCSTIQLAIRNGDNRRGTVALALVLTDSTHPGKPSQILDPQPVRSTQPGRFALKLESPQAPFPAPTFQDETLTFPLPQRTTIQQFDEITVMFLPDPERSALGAKISIRNFTLIPR